MCCSVLPMREKRKLDKERPMCQRKVKESTYFYESEAYHFVFSMLNLVSFTPL